MMFRIATAMLVLAGCGLSSSREPATDLALVHSFVLEETDSLFLGHFWTITVTTSPYRVYVPDAIADQIRVFDSLGGIVRFFGSRGEGPGELDGPKKCWSRETRYTWKKTIDTRYLTPVVHFTG